MREDAPDRRVVHVRPDGQISTRKEADEGVRPCIAHRIWCSRRRKGGNQDLL